MGRIRGVVLLTLVCGCVESTPGNAVDGGNARDLGVAPDATRSDVASEMAELDAGVSDGASNEVGNPGSDGVVDFFTTPGCYFRDGGCVPRRDAARCTNLQVGAPHDVEQCLDLQVIGCMENVRSSQGSATCTSRLEADGVTRRYVVFSADDYEVLPHAERYTWGREQCGDAIGWQGCPSP